MLFGPLECFPDIEALDPHVDIHALFTHYADLYFHGALGACSVEWSSRRMTSCGGVCEFRGGGCIIKLSEPLLKFRPTADIKNVLLHEMIHAYNFLVGPRDDGRDGHGAQFQLHMRRINSSTATDFTRPPEGYHITIRHSMIAEVEYYRTHHWRCNRCGNMVKRSMNRPPQEADCWRRAGSSCRDPRCSWHMHLRHCGGDFVKVKEPEGFQQQRGGSGRRQKPENGGGSSSQAGAPQPQSKPLEAYFPKQESSQGPQGPQFEDLSRETKQERNAEDLASRREKLASAALARMGMPAAVTLLDQVDSPVDDDGSQVIDLTD